MKVRVTGRLVSATLAAAATLLVAAPAAAETHAERAAQLKAEGKGRGIVAFKRGAGANGRAAVAAAGGRVALDLDALDAVAVELPAGAVAALQRHAAVEFVEEDAPRRAFRRPSSAVS